MSAVGLGYEFDSDLGRQAFFHTCAYVRLGFIFVEAVRKSDWNIAAARSAYYQ